MLRYRRILEGHPEPWTLDPKWADGHIRTPGRSAALLYLLFPIAWISFSLFLFFPVGSPGRIMDFPRNMLTYVFLIIGVAVSIGAVRRAIPQWVYGSSVLVMETLPASPGSTLRARLETGISASVRDYLPEEFEVRLACYHRRNGDSRDRSTFRHARWESTHAVEGRTTETRDGQRVVVPILVQIPDDAVATSTLPDHTSILWRVEVESNQRKPPYRAQFEVPVFDTRPAALRQVELVAQALSAEPAGSSQYTNQSDDGIPDLAELATTIQPTREAADPRPVQKRLIRGLAPYETLEQTPDKTLILTQVRGDQPIRRIRRLSGFFLLFLIFVAGSAGFPVFALSVVSLLAAHSVKPSAIRVSAAAEVLRYERVEKTRVKTTEYPWTAVGLVRAYQASFNAWTIQVMVHGNRSINLNLAVADKAKISAITAAMEARRILPEG